MWVTKNSDLNIKKWALISSILMFIAVFLPLPGTSGMVFWPFQDIKHFDFREIILVLLVIILLAMPWGLGHLLNGKALSASLLAYCLYFNLNLLIYCSIPSTPGHCLPNSFHSASLTCLPACSFFNILAMTESVISSCKFSEEAVMLSRNSLGKRLTIVE